MATDWAYGRNKRSFLLTRAYPFLGDEAVGVLHPRATTRLYIADHATVCARALTAWPVLRHPRITSCLNWSCFRASPAVTGETAGPTLMDRSVRLQPCDHRLRATATERSGVGDAVNVELKIIEQSAHAWRVQGFLANMCCRAGLRLLIIATTTWATDKPKQSVNLP